jgi:hypothetical protein
MKTVVAKYTMQHLREIQYGLDVCNEFYIYTNIEFIENANCSININKIKEKYGLLR